MALYAVSYDLHNQRDYPPVWDAIQKVAGVKLLESLWLVSTTLDAGAIRERIKAAADKDDSVVVIPIQFGGQWSTYRAMDAGTSWLQTHVRGY